MLDYEKERRKREAKTPKRIINFFGEEKTDFIFFLSYILNFKYRRKVLVIDNTKKNILKMIVGVDEQDRLSRKKNIVYKLDGSEYEPSLLRDYDIILNFVGFNIDLDKEYINSRYSHSMVITNMQKDAVSRCRKLIHALDNEIDLIITDCVECGVSVGNVLFDLRYKVEKNIQKNFCLCRDVNTYREFIKLQYGQNVVWENLSMDMDELLYYMAGLVVPDRVNKKG